MEGRGKLQARGGAGLPPHHREPFDRMLVAQAAVEELTLVARDPVFTRYGVALIAA
jgi:PIN domain nuclease of toxin-antitoxin system